MWGERVRKGQTVSHKGSYKLNVLMCAEVTQWESMLQEKGGGGGREEGGRGKGGGKGGI